MELKNLPDPYFGLVLEALLRRTATPEKAAERFLAAVAERLPADAVWLRSSSAAPSGLPGRVVVGEADLVAEDLTRAFAALERPALPKSVLLAPFKVGDRRAGVLGAARRGGDFRLGRAQDLGRLGAILGADLARREEERLTLVLDRIKEKVVAELRPRDLAYQILDGLYALVQYDHSAALLTYDSAGRSFRVDAEKVVWTKSKSAFIGCEIPVSEDLVARLAQTPAVCSVPAASASDDGAAALFEPLARYHSGVAVAEARAFLYAPLLIDGELLGLLKMAAYKRSTFDRRDVAVVERFLPAARVALANARVRTRLEEEALEAETRAGLVTLARAVAHDVNGAVGTIGLLAEQLSEDLGNGAFQQASAREDLDAIVGKAAICKRIFSNMLRVGGESSGRGPVDLNQVVLDLLPLLEAQVGRRPIRLTAELGTAVPAVLTSRHHVERILWNLITNALDALTGEGEVRIKTRTEDGLGTIEVEDDGPGIPAEILDRVQEPFFSTKRGSTGLGLAICRSLIWQHGGALRIHSQQGRGTRVEVQLPLVPEAVETAGGGA